MDTYIINGGNRLSGCVPAQGSKNSSVAVIIASLITEGVSEILRIPDISDVRGCIELLQHLGCRAELGRDSLNIDTSDIHSAVLPDTVLKKMRASSYLIGAQLARFGYCDIPDCGGCNFGSRPVNYHISAMKSLGAELEYTENGLRLTAPRGLHGGIIHLAYPSVGATVNSVIAASLSDGVTLIYNAAREPHIVDLVNFLNLCGADISGTGTDILRVVGKRKLHGAKISVTSDMIEAGTYLIYGLLTGGKVCVENTDIFQLSSLLDTLEAMGATTVKYRDAVSVDANNLRCTDIITSPFPGFPTDLQPQIATLMGISDGIGTVNENVFENRFGYVSSLLPFGFCGFADGRRLIVSGVSHYTCARSEATDLRGGAALVGAALSAEGESIIGRSRYIERGYSGFIEKLSSLGADIKTE